MSNVLRLRIGSAPLYLAVFLLASVPLALAQSTPVPLINDPLVPASAAPGGLGFTLTVNGSGFVSSSTLEWNGVPLSTTVVSSSELTAHVAAAKIKKAGTASVTVVNANVAASNVVYFPIASLESAVVLNSSLATSAYGGIPVVGDFNNDGIQDIALSFDFYGGIVVLLGHGDGTFGSPITSTCGTSSAVMVTGDFNDDGKLDLALAGSSGLVCLGNGDGTFTAQTGFTLGLGASSIVAGDFNGDGKLDVAITESEYNYDYAVGYVQVALGNGDGTFSVGQDIEIGSSNTYNSSTSAAVGDFNRDGILDLAITDTETGQIAILLGNGDGTFQTPVFYNVGVYPQWVVSADFNSDGKLDLAVSNNGSNTLSVLLGNGDGTFQAHTDYPTNDEPAQLATGDFNGDGKLDLAVTDSCYYVSCSGYVSILLGNGDGTFQTHTDLVARPELYGLAMADFNNDGRLDFAVVSEYGAEAGEYVMLQGTAQPDPVLVPTSLTFAGQTVGSTSPPQNVTLTNNGSGNLTISSMTFTGADPTDFAQTNTCGTMVIPGASCTISVTFTPLASGTRTATLNVNDNATGSPQTVSLTGTGQAPAVTLSTTSLTFPTTLINTKSSYEEVILTNTGNGTLYLNSITVTGEFLEQNDCGSSVPADGSCGISVQFAPVGIGTLTGSVSISDDATGSPQTVSLTGAGTVVKLSAIGLNFGDQRVGTTSAPIVVVLTNVSSQTLRIAQITITGADPKDFSETNNCGSSLPARGSCQIKVKFGPTAQGQRTATLSISDNGGGSPQTVALSGTGT